MAPQASEIEQWLYRERKRDTMRRTQSFQIARDWAEELHLAFGLSVVDGLYYVGTDAELDKVAVVIKQSWERGTP